MTSNHLDPLAQSLKDLVSSRDQQLVTQAVVPIDGWTRQPQAHREQARLPSASSKLMERLPQPLMLSGVGYRLGLYRLDLGQKGFESRPHSSHEKPLTEILQRVHILARDVGTSHPRYYWLPIWLSPQVETSKTKMKRALSPVGAQRLLRLWGRQRASAVWEISSDSQKENPYRNTGKLVETLEGSYRQDPQFVLPTDALISWRQASLNSISSDIQGLRPRSAFTGQGILSPHRKYLKLKSTKTSMKK